MRSPSLLWQVIVLVSVAVVVSVGIFAGASIVRGTQDIAAAERAEQQATTELAALAMHQTVIGARDTLIAVGASMPPDALHPPDEEQLTARFLPLVPDVFASVHLRDARGTIFSLPPGAPEPRQYVDGLSRQDQLTWQVVLPGHDPDLRVIGQIPDAALLDVLYRFQQEGRELALALPDGTLVADTLVGSGLLAASDEARGPLRTEAPVDGTSLAVMVFDPSGTAVIRDDVVATAFMTGGLVIVAGVAVGTLMSRRVTAPIREIADVARRIQHGDFGHRVRPRGPPEVQGLGEDMNKMADELGRDRTRLIHMQAELAAQVEKRTRQLSSRQQEMEQFFYGVAHDIKGPAVGLGSVLQLLEESMERVDSRQAMLFEQGQDSAEQLRRLVEDLLQFAAVERLRPALERVDLRAFVRSSLAGLSAFAKERGVNLVNDAPRCMVSIDPAVLRRVVQNLARNAVLHMPADARGVVQVRGRADGRDLEITVQDNGRGVPAEVVRRMFQPFTRGKGPAPGTGIGLSIVRRLVEAHDGTISCHSAEGQGTRFTVRLPDAVVREAGAPRASEGLARA